MKKIAIITGGSSSERTISLRSAMHVENSLQATHQIALFDFPNDMNAFVNQYQEFDVIIPLIHGRGGEDGALQGFLETLGKPYLFSGIQAHAIALDKAKTKALVSRVGIPVAPSMLVDRTSAPVVYKQPLVVKPYDGGSSVATVRVDSQNTLDIALKDGFAYSKKILLEDYVQGDEFTVAVVETKNTLEALPVILIQTKTGFFDFTSKYDGSSLATEICPAPISEALETTLKDFAILAHQTLGCRHVSRSDFIVDQQGIPRFLETNTIPGMTKQSLLPKALIEHGTNLKTILCEWIEAIRPT